MEAHMDYSAVDGFKRRYVYVVRIFGTLSPIC